MRLKLIVRPVEPGDPDTGSFSSKDVVLLRISHIEEFLWQTSEFLDSQAKKPSGCPAPNPTAQTPIAVVATHTGPTGESIRA